MTRRTRVGIVLGFLFSLAAETGWTCVNLTFDLNETTYSLNVNSTPTLGLTVKAVTAPGGCSFFLTFGYGAGSSPTSRALRQTGYDWPFNLYKDPALTYILRDLADASSNDHVVTGSFAQAPGLSQQVVNYRVSLDLTNMYRRFGLYSETIAISLYQGTLASNTFRVTKSVTLTYDAAKKIDLSLVGTGDPFNMSSVSRVMDFGANMTTGQSEAVDLLVRFNAGYRVKLSSLRDGTMKHETQSNTVPYILRFDGSPVNLAGSSGNPVTVTTGTGIAPVGGTRFPIEAEVGALGAALAGQYEDEITVTVESAE